MIYLRTHITMHRTSRLLLSIIYNDVHKYMGGIRCIYTNAYTTLLLTSVKAISGLFRYYEYTVYMMLLNILFVNYNVKRYYTYFIDDKVFLYAH